MSKCVFAGTFDPFTNGHLSSAVRAAEIFDQVLIAVANNSAKNPMLSAEDRFALVKKAVSGLKNVKVEICKGLLADFCRENGANCIVKGVRNAVDFDCENEMLKANLALSGIETLFLPALPQLSFVSSSFVKELISLGKDVSVFVPPEIYSEVMAAYALKREN